MTNLVLNFNVQSKSLIRKILYLMLVEEVCPQLNGVDGLDETADPCVYIDYRRDLVSVLSTAIWHRAQRVPLEEAATTDLKDVLLAHCTGDAYSPFVREWALYGTQCDELHFADFGVVALYIALEE